MSVRVPWVGEVETLTRDDVRALLELPKTVARFNNALATFAQSVERFDRMVKRVDRLTQPLEAPMGAMTDRLEQSSNELGTVLSSLDRLAGVLDQLTPRFPGALSAWRRPPQGASGGGHTPEAPRAGEQGGAVGDQGSPSR